MKLSKRHCFMNGGGFAADALKWTAKWSRVILLEMSHRPGSTTSTEDTILLPSLEITTSNVWPRKWVGSWTCCCIPHDCRRLTKRVVSLSEETSRWKFRSPTIRVSLFKVAYLARNVGHSSSKNSLVFKPLAWDGGGLYMTASRNETRWQSSCSPYVQNS